MKQDWEDLLPLLVEHNMIKCKVTDDVESYEYVKASWECFETMTRDTLDIRTTPVRQPGTPLTWYISLGYPQYNKPVHQLKAIKEKKFAYMEYRHSPQDNALRRELRTLSKKILLDKAQSRLDSARIGHKNKHVLDQVFKQNSFRNSFPSTTFAFPAEATARSASLKAVLQQTFPKRSIIKSAMVSTFMIKPGNMPSVRIFCTESVSDRRGTTCNPGGRHRA
jgi:hypothetical protein